MPEMKLHYGDRLSSIRKRQSNRDWIVIGSRSSRLDDRYSIGRLTMDWKEDRSLIHLRHRLIGHFPIYREMAD